MVNKNVKTVHICTNCGSDNVRIKVWIKPNNNNEIVDVIDKNNEYGWCDDCQHETIIKKVQMNANAKIIGFQVVGNDETSFEGDIHRFRAWRSAATRNLNFSTNCPAAFCQTRVMG